MALSIELALEDATNLS